MKTQTDQHPVTIVIKPTFIRPIPCYYPLPYPNLPVAFKPSPMPVPPPSLFTKQPYLLPQFKEEEPGSQSTQEKDPVIEEQLDIIFASVRGPSKKTIRKIKSGEALIRARERKTKTQIETLERELADIKELDSENIAKIAEKTGLRKTQVYKWYWDHKKRTEGESKSDS